MEENLPENLRLLYELSQEESKEILENIQFSCRRIRRTAEERALQDRKHRCALEEILAKKQRITHND